MEPRNKGGAGTGFSLYERPASDLEIIASNSGSTVYPQNGKQRSAKEPPLCIDAANRTVFAGKFHNASGLSLENLPPDVVIVDIDNMQIAQAYLKSLKPEDGLGNWFLINHTKRGCHLIGRLRFPLPKRVSSNRLCLRTGAPAEFFTGGSKKHVTIWDSDKRLEVFGTTIPVSELNFSDLGFLPAFFEPVLIPKGMMPEDLITVPIPEGRRWTTISGLIPKFRNVWSPESLSFVCDNLCSPSLEPSDQIGLIKYLEKFQTEELQLIRESDFSDELLVTQEIASKIGEDFFFDIDMQCWFKRFPPGFWQMISGENELIAYISKEIEASTVLRKKKNKTTVAFYGRVAQHLKLKLGREMVPLDKPLFPNGVLEELGEKDFRLRPISANEFTTVAFPFPFDATAKLSEEMALFLVHLCDGSPVKLNCIRSFIRNLVVYDPTEEVAISMEGVAAAGKSLFARLLKCMFYDEQKRGDSVTGNSQSVREMELNRLGSRFDSHGLGSVRLLIFPDVGIDSITQTICSVIKRLISRDGVTGEVKNGPIYTIQPKCRILFHSNHRWASEEMNSGFKRRLLYLEVKRTAIRQDPNLFSRLRKNLPGLLNWALQIPKDIQRLSGAVEAINRHLGSLNEDVFRDWVIQTLRPNKESKIPLGASSNCPQGLYLSYVDFLGPLEKDAVPARMFGTILTDTLRSLGCPVSKVRLSQGFFIQGVSFKEDEHVETDYFPKRENELLEKLKTQDPLLGWIDNDPDLSFDLVAMRLDLKDSINAAVTETTLGDPPNMGRVGLSPRSCGSSEQDKQEQVNENFEDEPQDQDDLEFETHPEEETVPVPAPEFEDLSENDAFWERLESGYLDPPEKEELVGVSEFHEDLQALEFLDVMKNKRAQFEACFEDRTPFLTGSEPKPDCELGAAPAFDSGNCSQHVEPSFKGEVQANPVLETVMNGNAGSTDSPEDAAPRLRQILDLENLTEDAIQSKIELNAATYPIKGRSTFRSENRTEAQKRLIQNDDLTSELMLRRFDPVSDKAEIEDLIKKGLEKYRLEPSIVLPEIDRYHFTQPYKRRKKWIELRENLKTLPLCWAELSSKLNVIALAYLNRLRDRDLQALKDQPRETLSEAERKHLKTVNNKLSIRAIFPQGYIDGKDGQYSRLNPEANKFDQRTSILNLKKRHREEVIKFLNEKILPEGVMLKELDLAACHTGIFVGLATKMHAPFTAEAFESPSFWGRIIEHASSFLKLDVRKEYLKRVFYKALNGGFLESPADIVKTLQDYYEIDSSTAFEIGKQLLSLPVLQELRNFQHEISGRSFVHLIFKEDVYRGANQPGFRSEDKKNHPSRSNFHPGLMSSRVLVTAELVLVLQAIEALLEKGAIPISLEHDGLLVLDSGGFAIEHCATKVREASEKLLGVKIDIESK